MTGSRLRPAARGLVVDDDALAAESITCFRWWTSAELAAHDGPEVFGPRDLPALFAELLRDCAPAVPRALGL